MQKLIRAAFGNNNVDTCARVCHSPTGYGLKTTFGTSAGTQDFNSVDECRRDHDHRRQPDRRPSGVRLAHEEAPARGRQADRPRSAPHRPGAHAAYRGRLSSAAQARHQCRRRHRAGACDRDRRAGATRNSCASAATGTSSRIGRASSPTSATARKRSRRSPACPPSSIRGAARLYATGGNGAIYYGLGVTEHSQGSTTVMAIANLAMATGNIGRRGRRREPAARAEQRAGLLRHGLVPARGVRLSPRVRGCHPRHVRDAVGPPARRRARPAHSQHDRRRASTARSRASTSRARTFSSRIPNTQHMAAGLAAMECVVVQDLFLIETANYAHVFLPGSTFLEKNGTFTNAERRIQMVRKVMAPMNGYEDWQITAAAVQRARLSDALQPPVRDHGRDRAADADLRRRLLQEARRARLGAVAVQREGAGRHADHAYQRLRRAARASSSSPNMWRPTRRPARATRCCSPPGASSRQYNVGAQTQAHRQRGLA